MKPLLIIAAIVAGWWDLKRRLARQETFMARAIDQLRTDISELNDATTAVGEEIAKLRDSVSENMTADEVAEVKAGLDAATDRLKGLAANPNQPVPPVDPNA